MCMITNIGRGIAPKVKNLLVASAVVTGGLLAASCFKTPKPAENATAAEKIEYYMNNETVKEPDAYEWDSRQSVVSNVVDNAKVTGQHIAKAADKATDHPVPLTGALALELMGVGLAGAAIKRNKRLEYQKAAFEKQKIAKMEEAQRAEEAKRAEEARKAAEMEEAKKAEEAKKSELKSIELPNHGWFSHSAYLQDFGVEGYNPIPTKKETSYNGYKEYYQTKDGCTVEAGIRYARVPQGVNKEDYTYRYVKLLDPKIKGKTTEVGSIHYLDKEGYAVEVHVERKLASINRDNKGDYEREYENETDWYALKSKERVSYFPRHEQQQREEIVQDFIVDRWQGLGYFSRYSMPKILEGRFLEIKK